MSGKSFFDCNIMPSLAPTNKRKSTPYHATNLHKRRQINAIDKNQESNNREEEKRDSDTDDDDNDGKTRATVASSRRSNANSRAMNAILQSIQKGPPAASLPPSTTTAPLNQRNNGTATMQAARSTASGRSVSISVNSEHASPPCASLPVGHERVIQPSPVTANVQEIHIAPHEVAEIHGQDLLDDASSLSATDNDNAKSMRLLQQYFVSLSQSGTTRTIREEKDLITNKIPIIFKRIKFIIADTDLTFEGNIAKILYREMRIPDNFKAVWWEQMKNHARKKMDEKRSNCGAAIKKSILSKYIMAVFLNISSSF